MELVHQNPKGILVVNRGLCPPWGVGGLALQILRKILVNVLSPHCGCGALVLKILNGVLMRGLPPLLWLWGTCIQLGLLYFENNDAMYF